MDGQKTVIITGAGGVIGSVLKRDLDEFRVVALTREDCDLTDLAKVEHCLDCKADVVIHMGWLDAPIYEHGHFDSANVLMACNVLEAAARRGIPRVVLASSIHVREYRSQGDEILQHHPTWPTSIYGATKIYLEELGKYYAHYRGLEVVAVRLGGVNSTNSPHAKSEPDYAKIFLSHEDLVATFRRVVNHKEIPDLFEVMYAVSDNSD